MTWDRYLPPCELCDSNQQMHCESTIGFQISDTFQCGCCKAIYKIDENDNVSFLYMGEKHG